MRRRHFKGGGKYFTAALHAGLEVRDAQYGECAAMGASSRWNWRWCLAAGFHFQIDQSGDAQQEGQGFLWKIQSDTACWHPCKMLGTKSYSRVETMHSCANLTVILIIKITWFQKICKSKGIWKMFCTGRTGESYWLTLTRSYLVCILFGISLQQHRCLCLHWLFWPYVPWCCFSLP